MLPARSPPGAQPDRNGNWNEADHGSILTIITQKKRLIKTQKKPTDNRSYTRYCQVPAASSRPRKDRAKPWAQTNNVARPSVLRADDSRRLSGRTVALREHPAIHAYRMFSTPDITLSYHTKVNNWSRESQIQANKGQRIAMILTSLERLFACEPGPFSCALSPICACVLRRSRDPLACPLAALGCYHCERAQYSHYWNICQTD